MGAIAGLRSSPASSPHRCRPIPPTTLWQSSMSCHGRPSRPPSRCIPRSWIWTTSWRSKRLPKPSTPPTPAASESARSQLATFQTSVDKIAAAQYMGGRPDGLDALLTATSPQGAHRPDVDPAGDGHRDVVTDEELREVGTQAAVAEEASAKSAAEAKTAAEQAAAVRADLQSKQSQLQVQIAIVKAQYQALSPNQREALAAMPPAPPIPPPAPTATERPRDHRRTCAARRHSAR